MPAARTNRPHARRSATLAAWTAAALAGLVALGTAATAAEAPSPSPAGTAQPGPGPAELEFWRSTERLGTADAYAAYLAAYPSGHFAALARLAIAQVGRAARAGPAIGRGPTGTTTTTGTTGASPGETTSAAPPEASLGAAAGANPTLRHFSEPSTSGAITFQLGDRFQGPGAVTVGWLGARKQLVLPAGEWVVLAAIDHPSTGGNAEMTTLRFGRFSGRRLQSMLVFSFTRRGTSISRWTDIERCQAGEPAALMHAATPPAAVRSECMALWTLGGIRFASERAGDEALASLERLGGSYGGPALVTAWYFADRPNGYLRATRIDWLHAVYGDDSGPASAWSRTALSTSPERQRHAQALMRWAEAYRELAGTGFRRKLDELDLKPGLPARPGEELAHLTDVPWPARSAAP